MQVYTGCYLIDSSIYLEWRSRFQSFFGIKKAIGIKTLTAVDRISYVTLIKPALIINIW